MGKRFANKYWLTEAIRHLLLALIGAQGKVRKHINAALIAIAKHQKEENAKDNDSHS